MTKIRKWRKMTWVLWAWCILILVWAIAGAESANCEGEEFQEACEAGAGLGIAFVLFFGFFGFVFFGLIWFMTRPKHRICPRCGEDVRKGQTECSSCGQAMGQPVTA